MLDFLTLKPEAFGLDISDLSLKIAQLSRGGKFFKLTSFGQIQVQPGVIDGGEIKDQDQLAKTIRLALKMVKGKKLKTKYVVASLPEEKAFLQVIQLPRMSEEEMKKAVCFEAENYVPLPLEKVYLDSQIVPPVYNHLDHLDVLLAALPKTTVDAYLSTLEKAELKPVVLEIESQAICRALVEKEATAGLMLLIDFGAMRSSFIIFSGHSLRFTTSLPVSSQQFTQALCQGRNLSFEEAEKLKIQHGIGDSQEGKKNFDILAPLLTNFVGQIQKYLQYYQTHTSHEHLSPSPGSADNKMVKILLSGGGSNLKGFADFLGQKLKIPVELANPWVNILPAKTPKQILGLSYKESLGHTTALGLALRAANYD